MHTEVGSDIKFVINDSFHHFSSFSGFRDQLNMPKTNTRNKTQKCPPHEDACSTFPSQTNVWSGPSPLFLSM